tara:strand:- start:17 stop:277 length:261 start_codon:yes stop_codon:yes gene_type:complete
MSDYLPTYPSPLINKLMDLPAIIHLYALITSAESNKPTVLTRAELRELNWKPEVIKMRPRGSKLNVESFLQRNLKGFFKYMIEYSE